MQGRNLDDYQKRYYFNDIIKKGKAKKVPVYILDSGAFLDIPVEFDQYRKHGKSTIRFIHIGEDIDQVDGKNSDDDSYTNAGVPKAAKTHGTSMLALMGGLTVGVMPFGTEPILVRVPRRFVRGGGTTMEDWIEGFSKICDDLKGDSSEARAILLMSVYWSLRSFQRPPTDDADLKAGETTVIYSEGFTIRLKALLAAAIRRGVIPVTGSGNNGLDEVTGFPAVFGGKDASGNIDLPELIVAGALAHDTRQGDYYVRSGITNVDNARGLPHVWAPGDEIPVPRVEEYVPATKFSKGKPFYRQSFGSSDAAALTAGLLAYFIKMKWENQIEVADTSPMGFKNHLINLAWQRPTSPGETRDLRAIWNGVELEPHHQYCFWENPWPLFKRAADIVSPAEDLYQRADATATSDSCRIPWETAESATASTFSTSTTSKKKASTITTSSTKPSSTGITCTQDKDCRDYECERDETPYCLTMGFTPDGRICLCRSKSTTTSTVATTSSAEPSNTGLGCAKDSDCSEKDCPDGKISTCVKMAIVPGAGLCVCTSTSTTTTSAKPSTSTKTTSAKPTATKTPLEIKDPVCNDPDDYKGTVDPNAVENDAFNFFGNHQSSDLAAGDDEVSDELTHSDLKYSYTVSWIDGCVTKVDTQNVAYPLGGDTPTAYGMFVDAFQQCDYIGGYIDVGCLRYSGKAGF
ncbi:hypothetical protein G7Z17_g2450 [Cylindrodendrum hubeiense]|uniref:Peptidase S8/S53 domain-containing protein n=1 Tax=Cylindrodendrum hubeiense TaxID=595255 RepID=A0A9P5HHP5_9HYPO|nr:hypothetical protein G7Z17_g2450 [Cylindrodendrum hubeiense]